MDLPKWSVRLMLEPQQARAITAEEPLLAPLRFGGVHGMAVAATTTLKKATDLG